MKHLLTTITAILILITMGLVNSSMASAEQVEIVVKVVHASKNGNEVHENVKELYSRLSKMFDFTSYKMLLDVKEKGDYSQKQIITLPNNQKLILTPIEKDKDFHIKVEMEIEGVIKTDFRLKDGGTIILGGTKHKDGVLILVIKITEL